MYREIVRDLNKAANPKKAKCLMWFFKTGKGEYGEGDVFLGIIVPKLRKIAKRYISLGSADIQRLLDSKYHEYRMIALFLLIEKYEKADEKSKKKIVSIYLKNAKRGRINNWDLVDLSAPKILGEYLFDKEKTVLYNLVKSKSLWERRIAILSTFTFIKYQKFSDTLKISKILISDREDLIHKAVGWMLREIGKRNQVVEKKFLDKYTRVMPRTMLRYAIEKFNKGDRKKYLLF